MTQQGRQRFRELHRELRRLGGSADCTVSSLEGSGDRFSIEKRCWCGVPIVRATVVPTCVWIDGYRDEAALHREDPWINSLPSLALDDAFAIEDGSENWQQHPDAASLAQVVVEELDRLLSHAGCPPDQEDED
jgi:hypothetical protein